MGRSKRKSSGDEHGKPASKKKRSSSSEHVALPAGAFTELTQKAGLKLSATSPPYLEEEQAVFQRNLGRALDMHPDQDQTIKEFVEGLSNFIQESKKLQWLLSPTGRVHQENREEVVSHHDSMMRMLLNVDLLQEHVLLLMIEKLVELSSDDAWLREEVNLPLLIVNQLKWLDHIVRPQNLCEKLLEALSVIPLDLQRDVISNLPEILEDSTHTAAAENLSGLLTENNQLAVPILHALSNLNIPTDALANARGVVVGTLASVELQDLPVMVRFLLQTTPANDAIQVVGELREHLDFSSGIIPKAASTPHGKPNSGADAELLTVEAIATTIRYQKPIAEACIRVIECVTSSDNHRVVDLFMISVLHQAGYGRPIESLMRNKARAGHIAENLVKEAFKAHTQVMQKYVTAVLGLSEVLLRSPEAAVVNLASLWYKYAFLNLNTYSQQEVVGQLVTHIGSGNTAEVDAALDLLVQLVSSNPDRLAPYAIFVKGVLEYVERLSISQIRKLYFVLSTLAFGTSQSETAIQDELHILLRKQLSNTDPKYKRMGVIGAIMVVKSMACMKNPEESVFSQEGRLSEEDLRMVLNLLTLVRQTSTKSTLVAALFYDELASLVIGGQLDGKVLDWISERIITDFQDEFVKDLEANSERTCEVNGIPLELMRGLDDDSEGAIAINLLPLLVKGKAVTSSKAKNKERWPSVVTVPAHFRLLAMCENIQNEGNLEGIDALLGCPTWATEDDLVTKVTSLAPRERTLVCEGLFLTINWFRELINAFAGQSDPEMKAKVITRLNNIVNMQQLLQCAVPEVGNFTPPPANFDWEQGESSSISSANVQKKGRKPGKGGKKKKSDKGNETTVNETAINSQSTQNPDQTVAADTTRRDSTEDSKSANSLSLDKLRPYYREFDTTVFCMLQYGLITKTALDTEMNPKGTQETSQLSPAGLELLLQDLVAKLHHSLLPGTARRSNPFNKGNTDVGFCHLEQKSSLEVGKWAVGLLPALCDHLESTSAYFQTLLAVNDGIIDGPGTENPDYAIMENCMHLLFQAVYRILAWRGFHGNGERELYREAVRTLASRLQPASTQLSQTDLKKYTFQYLENFSGTITSLECSSVLCNLLVSLAERSSNMEDLQPKIADVAEGFLKREWMLPDGQRRKGAKHNEYINSLLRIYLGQRPEVLEALQKLVTGAVPELLEADKNGCAASFGSLNKNTFPVYYRVILSELVVCAKQIQPPKSRETSESKQDKVMRWNVAVCVFQVLVNLVKAFDGRGNLGAVLKYGRQFVELFLKNSMPLLDGVFRSQRDDVQAILKNLQQCTRSLHHICGHSKILKDVSLTNQVPGVKKVLEMFVYRVKAMLTINRCLEAFWLGNLKNRDLQGEEIVSQASTVAESEADPSDDEAPTQDSSDSEVEVSSKSDGASERGDEESDSESYSEKF